MRQTEINEYGQNNTSPYVYIITRLDLSIPAQCVQSCHAAIEATKAFKQPQETCNLVVCTVADESQLYKWTDKLRTRGIEFATFYEPDIGNQLTAIATEPVYKKQRKVFSGLNLMKGEQNGKHSNETTSVSV